MGGRLARHLTVAMAMVIAVGCTGGGDEEDHRPRPSGQARGNPFHEVTDHIVSLVPAASIDRDGRPVDPGFAFATDVPRITVLAHVGSVTGSPMDITWFAVTDQGEQELFTHTVDVSSFQTAYSVGENPGTLVPGNYRVEATVEGDSFSTSFTVRMSAEPATVGLATATATATATAKPATAGPPGPGDSGAVGPPTGADGETELTTFFEYAPVDPSAPDIAVGIVARVTGGDGRAEAQGTMGGSTRTISIPTATDGLLTESLRFDPCVHPGGSDLPGTKARFDITLYEGSSAAFSDTYLTELGPDQTAPVLEVTSEPPPGSRVHPGQQFVISIVGKETRAGGTWQTGVRQIKLTNFDTGEVVGDQVFGDQAQSCEQKAWSKGLDVPYTVPGDAPPVIRLLAEGLDFGPNRGSLGLTYYTGEVWTGKVTGTAQQADCTPAKVPITGEITIQVGDDGTVTGTVTERRPGFSCNGVAAPAFEKTYQITGQKTAAAFELRAGSRGFVLPITGTRAGATFRNLNAGYGATERYTVECVSCAA